MAENSKSFLSDLSQKLTDQPDLTNKLVEFNLKRGREEYKGPKDLVNTETTGNETTSPVNKAHRSDSPYSPGDPISSEKLIQSEDNLSVFEMSKMEEKLAEALEELKSERQLRIDVQSQLQTLTEAQNHLAEGINLNTTFTNRNHRDLVDAMKISNRDQARLNGAIMKVQGADLMYLFDGEIGYSTWKKFVIQLLERLQLPDDLVKDIPLIHVGWGNVNETVSWKDKNKPVTKRPDDAVKKTHLEVICPTPGIPTFLKTRTGIDKIIKAKNNAAFGYSKFLSVTQLMGPASEKMNLYSSNTKGNMMKIIKEFKSIDQAKKAYVEEKYPYLKHINKIYCFGPHNADLKIVFTKTKRIRLFHTRKYLTTL